MLIWLGLSHIKLKPEPDPFNAGKWTPTIEILESKSKPDHHPSHGPNSDFQADDQPGGPHLIDVVALTYPWILVQC